MKLRIIAGVLGGALFLLLILKGGVLFYLAVGFLISAGVWEYYRLARATGVEMSLPLVLGLSLLYYVAQVLSVNYQWWPGSAGTAGFFLLLTLFGSFLLRIRSENLKELLAFAGGNLLGLVYPGMLLTYAALIRGFPPPLGWQVLILSFLTIWGNDTGAYFVGSFLGKRFLAPKISPHKTVEGAIGGLLIGTVAGTIFGTVVGLPRLLLFFTPVIGIMGQMGDLFESLLKRGAGVKDSGEFLPGHGGVLDRFDSTLFTLPLIYYLVLYMIK